MKIPRKLAGAIVLGAITVGGVAVSAGPAQASTTTSFMYEHQNYAGARLRTYTTPDGFVCTGTLNDVDLRHISLPADWHNRISSWHAYANCWTKFFDGSNNGGDSFGFYADRPAMDFFDNKANSVQFS